ncbi:hypothetical protein S40293_05290 [Stachybotrys chartarum IBT 40293]|nr:hypothetical protein S40293_05290 [Stachybotrys chartarum IBT 40293]
MSNPQDYTVGWISAIPTESVAARQFLDEQHASPDHVEPHDNNIYILGKIGRHNVVMATLPKGEYGTASAATVARDMLHSFPNIRIGLMVGIGGGAPTADRDVRLGDIVVSSRYGDQGGVFQYDFGKTIQDQTFHCTQVLDQVPTLLRAAVGGLEAQYEADGHQLRAQITHILEKKPRLHKKYSRPPATSDKLYLSDMVHRDPSQNCSKVCGNDPNHLVHREERGEEEDDPAIHYGLIASANQLMKDAHIRDRLAADKGVLCFEMEAAGLMNHFPCLVVRGICDYADSHKNKEWQGYAAMTAAAYTKELLQQIPPKKVEAERRISDTLKIIERKIGGMEQAVVMTKAAIDHIMSDRHVEKIQDWLCPADPSININHARKLRHEGTGAWLLKESFFQSWRSGSRQHLWLYGLAGCGKTVLSATVLDHLANMTNKLLLSFYFDFGDVRKQTVDGMLRSLAFQMYQHGPTSRPHLDALFQGHNHGRAQQSTNSLSDVVYKMLIAQEKVIVVLDALDESTTRSELLRWISDIVSRPELHHIQLLCTSRPELELQRNLPGMIGQENCISINNQAVNTDIRAYVTAQLAARQDFKDKRLSEDLAELIRKMVGDGADGMCVYQIHPPIKRFANADNRFRWAACQMDSLAACPNPKTLKRALECLPMNLTETYERMLQGIPENLRNGAMRLLQFLVHCKRPLTVPEAVEILATDIEADPPHFDIDSRVFDDTEVLRYCPGLMSIVKATGETGKILKELHLSHFSVKEFLQTQAEFKHPRASIIITRTCLTYLTDTTGTHDEIERNFPMAEFAARLWTSYGVSAERSEDVFREILVFLTEEITFQRWLHLLHSDSSKQYRHGRSLGSRLYYTCLAGLVRVVQELITNGSDLNARGGYYGNALQAAAYRGHDKIVQLLLDNKAEINAQGGSHTTALQAASAQGHSKIVQLLLDNGADINAWGEEYGNALLAASTEGHSETVQLLLDNGAELEAEHYGQICNALEIAAVYGHDGVIQVLLDNGVEINMQSGEFGNALLAASAGDSIKTVQLLLDKGAAINAQSEEHGNALLQASAGGSNKLVQLLLDNGAEINTQGGHYGNALQAAAFGGHGDTIQLLLDNGAEISTQSGHYGNALQAAACGGHGDTIQLLLDNGAEINTQGGHYGNALQAAAFGSNRNIVQLLLDNGAEINTQGGHYGNALQAAACSSNRDTVQLLLDNGVEINTQGGHYGNALQAAACGSNRDTVQLLLDNGAEINTQGGHYGNALQAAAFGGYDGIAQLLLDNGAEINTQGGHYGNALQAASFRGHNEIVQLLLNEGADINACGGRFDHAFSAASVHGHEQLAALLLRNITDLTITNDKGQTLLSQAVQRKCTGAVKLLISLDAVEINPRDHEGRTPLHLAVENGHQALVTMLLDTDKADVAAQDCGGLTALQLAAFNHHEHIERLLMESGAPFPPDFYGLKALFS